MYVTWNSSKLLDTEEGPDGKFSSSERNDAWTVDHLDGISRRLDGCKRLNFTVLKSAQNLLEEHNRSVDSGYNKQLCLINIIT
jgi:hypothetical protein